MNGVALVIPADPTAPIREVPWEDGQHLPTLYREIGCRAVDVVSLGSPKAVTGELTLWIDDEGAIVADAMINPRACYLTVAASGYPRPLCGTVVLTGGADDEGDTLPLTSAAQIVTQQMFSDDTVCAAVADLWFMFHLSVGGVAVSIVECHDSSE